MDKLNETLTFEDGMKLKENQCVKEHEDYTDEAFEKLCCSEAGMCTFKAVGEKELFYWHPSQTPPAAPLSPAPCSP